MSVSKKHLLELEAVFGRTVLARAIDLVYGKKPIVVYRSTDGNRELVEVPGSRFSVVYKIYPRINYCSCNSFRYWVLQNRTQATCKHVLASRLALLLKRVKVEIIRDDRFRALKELHVKDRLQAGGTSVEATVTKA